MTDDEILVQAARLSTATLHEAAGRVGALPCDIKPVSPDFTLCGRAFPVRSPGGDNLWIHRAVYAARPGDILVVDVSGAHEYGYWGEILSVAAIAQRLGGLVIDGGVRDGAQLANSALPVFSRTLCIRGTGKDFGGFGSLGSPVLMGDVSISHGDLILGDRDGVVAVPWKDAPTAIAASVERDRREAEIMNRLRAGETTLEIFGLE